MKIRRSIACTYLRISRWNFAGEPLADKAMVIGAPHISNWDGVFMTPSFWSIERPLRFLVKDSIVKKPIFGAFVRWIGAVGVDRTAAYDIVGRAVDVANTSESLTIVFIPKGMRSPYEYWKFGLYRIAQGADLPAALGFVDRRTIAFGWGRSIRLSGDPQADMDVIREFYSDKADVNPELTSVPRLRAKDDPAENGKTCRRRKGLLKTRRFVEGGNPSKTQVRRTVPSNSQERTVVNKYSQV